MRATLTTLATTLCSLLVLLTGLLALSLYLGAGVLRGATPGALSVFSGLLVVVPTLALAGGLRRAGPAAIAASALWPVGLVLGFPVFFPGERAMALHTGLSAVMMPLGGSPPLDWSKRLDDRLPSFGGAHAPPTAAQPLVLSAAPTSLLGADQVALPFEGEGRTLSIPVTVEGPGGRDEDVWMLFDTGATLTTLDTATLKKIGVRVPADAPEVTVHTAAGERSTRLALVDRVWVGGLAVEGVTVSVCDECGGDSTVGLLGLNVSGRFLATVDHQRSELVLEPQGGAENRALDIGHWLDLGATATRWPDGRVDVEVRAKNRANRPVALASVAIACDKTWLATLTDLAAGEADTVVVSLPVGSTCEGYTVRLERAIW